MLIYQRLTVVNVILLSVIRKIEKRQMLLPFDEKCLLYRLMYSNTGPQLWYCLQKLLNL